MNLVKISKFQNGEFNMMDQNIKFFCI